MNAWRTWTAQTWNERLLAHFFRSKEQLASPVVVLLVTAEELARATGDASAVADEARHAFVEAVCANIRRSGSLLEEASNYPEWPFPPGCESVPQFVAHLLFTCIAASESSEDLGDEGSFVSRLRDLSGDRLPEHSLQLLPRLWWNLSEWLKENEGRFRPLVLPDPGGLTRIGYTVKLAFPDRRDQRQLSELLDRAGLAGHEPPVGRVLALVASERNRFRKSFLVAFDEFRRLFDASAGRVQRLAHHRFWAAVREASLRGRGQAGLDDTAVRLSLLATEEDERLSLFAVADDRVENADYASTQLPFEYGPWRFALIPKGCEGLDSELLEQTIRAVLDGSLRLTALSTQVGQGLLPFATAPHGLLELAGQDQLGEVPVALVRRGLVPELVRIFGNNATYTRPSSHNEWVQVHNPRLRTVPSGALDGTSLSRTWILHESLCPTTTRLVGGVRADDGWLGAHEVLPHVVAPGASAVVARGTSGDVALTKLDDGTWSFPRRDMVGDYVIHASLSDDEDRRAIRFHEAPASEAFKPASEPDAWIVEEVCGTGALSNAIPFAQQPQQDDCAPLCERAAFLGADVGEFVANSEAAAWRVTHFAGRLLGARSNLSGECAKPTYQVESAHARSRWRKMLFKSSPAWSDPHFEDARRLVRKSALDGRLPRRELEQSVPVPDLAPMRLPSPAAVAERLVRVVAGRAATRAGIDWREWTELVQRILGVDQPLMRRVSRGWMEAGLIDVASYARWWHRAVFAQPPRLLAFRAGADVGATLSGLTLPTTLEAVHRAAIRLGMLVEERLSASSLVPRTISVRAADQRVLSELATTCHVELQWLDIGQLIRGVPSRHDGTTAPPTHYERSTRWLRWSLKQGDYPDVTVEHWMRRDRPDYWVASGGGRSLWFYDLNLARAWAGALLGEPVVKAAGDGFLEANHAFLPLPVARALSVLGTGRSGPVGIAAHRYPVGSLRLSELVLDIISRTFDPSRLAEPTQANG